MSELIGAMAHPCSCWNHHLLAFDRIAWPYADRYLRIYSRAADGDERSLQAGADLQWLVSKGLVFVPGWLNECPARLNPAWTAANEEVKSKLRTYIKVKGQQSAPALTHDDIGDAKARLVAIRLREIDGMNAVPVTSGWTALSEEPLSRAEVVRIVVKAIPIPSDQHSLQDVVDFREEARAEGLIQGLRVWINDMASGKLTEVEVSDKLEDLVSRYERALKLERMSNEASVVETLVVTTAEIAESLVKVKWSEAAKKLFEVKHKQIDLMKAEMTLPGREVAYIVKARERFGSSE
jgi:hypothetical protein